MPSLPVLRQFLLTFDGCLYSTKSCRPAFRHRPPLRPGLCCSSTRRRQAGAPSWRGASFLSFGARWDSAPGEAQQRAGGRVRSRGALQTARGGAFARLVSARLRLVRTDSMVVLGAVQRAHSVVLLPAALRSQQRSRLSSNGSATCRWDIAHVPSAHKPADGPSGA